MGNRQQIGNHEWNQYIRTTQYLYRKSLAQPAWSMAVGRPSRAGLDASRLTLMWPYLSLGLSMGLNAGISPGPLLALVVTASLRSGMAGGLAVALAPLVTDLPIITLSVLLVGSLPPEAVRWVGTLGGLVIIWMGIEAIRTGRRAVLPSGGELQGEPRRELLRGIAVNVLNPHPYLFWATVGGPTLVSGWRESPLHALAFLAAFYALLVGSKALIAWVVSRQAGVLSPRWYRWAVQGSGFLLVVMGIWFVGRAWAA